MNPKEVWPASMSVSNGVDTSPETVCPADTDWCLLLPPEYLLLRCSYIPAKAVNHQPPTLGFLCPHAPSLILADFNHSKLKAVSVSRAANRRVGVSPKTQFNVS